MKMIAVVVAVLVVVLYGDAMAVDQKISALPAASTPLAGTELVPIVQSGQTKQVAVSNLGMAHAQIMSRVSMGF